MAYGRISIKGASPAVGRTNSMSAASIATNLAAKAGLGSNVKVAQQNQAQADRKFALAMQDVKSGGKSGKTAAVAMKQPKRITVAKASAPVPKRKPTRAPGTKMTTMARK